MNPTCGPLPWVTTTPQPDATRPAMCRAVSRAFVVLLGDGAALAVEDERVAADRDDRATIGRHASTASRVAAVPPLTPRVSPSAVSAAAKHASGARAMPAPIWPDARLRDARCPC